MAERRSDRSPAHPDDRAERGSGAVGSEGSPPVRAHEGGLERDRLGDLYVAYAQEGIRLAFLLTGDRALAEDLVQDAFARLVGRLHHLFG